MTNNLYKMATAPPPNESMSSDKQSASSSELETDSSSEYDSDEDEPKLRYERVICDLPKIVEKDHASCMAVHSKFLILGTHWGTIHVLDYMGNNVGKVFEMHQTAVNQISVDDNGEYIASCSDDGRVNIIGLCSSEVTQIFQFNRPVKSVALEPEFSKTRQFVIGEEKLTLSERGFLNRQVTTVIHQGHGIIREIRWKGKLIAWANDTGVRVYDCGSKEIITSVLKEHVHRPDLYQCNLHWKNETTLMIGWADTVKVCVVRTRTGQDVKGLPPKFVEIVAMFQTETFMVAGISSLEDNVILLTYDKENQQEEKIKANRPNLLIVEPHMGSYEELANDALTIKGYENYRCDDYSLENVLQDNLFYIICPRDVVVARPRDLDDHVTWLVEHQKFEEAMEMTAEHEKELKQHTKQEIGKNFLDYLIHIGRFDEAAKLCAKIFGNDKSQWEDAAIKFSSLKQLKALAPYLPKKEPTLKPAIYEMVLHDFMWSEPKVFLQIVKEWPCNLYHVPTIIKAVTDCLDKNRNNLVLLQALAELYSYEKAFDKALAIYLRLKHKDVFVLIHKHNLYETVSDKILQLMEFDPEQALMMLLNNLQTIPVDKVVKQLETNKKYLFMFLDRLSCKDHNLVHSYAGEMVDLYAEFDKSKLLPFLRSSIPYPLEKAFQVVETRQFLDEQVFLLDRMGNIKRALKIITDQLRDVGRAIEFCKDHNDGELWEDLIAHSLDKPKFITDLLNSIGTHVDPIIIISRIKSGLKIPGLRDALVKILQDYNLQISLREGCKKILVADSFNLMKRLVKTQRKAIALETSHTCPVCQERILVNDLRYSSDISVFFCSHAVHELCLNNGTISCPVCTTQNEPNSGILTTK